MSIRRTIVQAILWALILSMVGCSGAIAESSWESITQVYAAAPAEWKESYATKSGKTVQIDAGISVPQVDTLPVLSVIRHRKLSKAVYDDYNDPEIYLPPYSDNTLTLGYKYDFRVPKRLYEKEIDFNEQYFYPASVHVHNGTPIDWDAHALNNPWSVREAYDYVLKKYHAMMKQYGIEEETYDFKMQYMATKGLYCEGQPVVDHEGYEFYGRQVLRGIPIAANIAHAYVNQYNRTYHTYEGIYENWVNLEFSKPESYNLIAMLWEETGVLVPDIPVLPFDAIKPVIEELILNDHIQEIYEVELCYLAYFTKDKNVKKGMVLLPTWVVHCEYRFKPTDYNEGEEDVFHNSGYMLLAFNAQTGKQYDPLEKSKNRSVCPEIMTK